MPKTPSTPRSAKKRHAEYEKTPKTPKKRHSYSAGFKLNAIAVATVKGNRQAAAELDIDESMIRYWRKQEDKLAVCNKNKKSFRAPRCRWPALEDDLEQWVEEQREDGRGVSTIQIRLKAKEMAKNMKIENFVGGASWCYRFMKRKNLSIRARTTLCQQLPPDFEQKKVKFITLLCPTFLLDNLQLFVYIVFSLKTSVLLSIFYV